MGTDRQSTYELAFTGDAGGLRSFLSALKSEFRSAITEIEATTKKVNLFSDLETKVKTSADALDAARASAKKFADELDAVRKAGAVALPNLTKDVRDAERGVTSATNAFNRNVDAITKQENALTRAGVDTRNLASEQLRLAEALRVATAAQEQAAAKQLLGFKTIADVQPQIARLNAAFQTLKDSGTLAPREIAIAQATLTAKIKETQGEVTKLGGGFQVFGKDTSSILTSTLARFLGFTAVVGTVGASISSAVGAAHDFENGLARIGTVTDLSQDKLRALGADVRGVARDLGLDLSESLKAVFELLRSGVPADNVIEVLKVSATAAKATFSDLGTGIKVSTLLIDSFGTEVKDLGRDFDVLIKSTSKGGPSLAGFADGGGKLLNVARAANIPLTDLSAILTVMVDKSNDAGGSIDALTKIIIRLGDPDVRAKLRALGIESTNILEIFTALGDQGIPLQGFLDLGIASTTKAAAGIATLTNNTKELVPALEDARKAAGTMGDAFDRAFQSPAEREKRLKAALNDLNVTVGESIGAGSKYADILARIINAFNGLGPATSRAAVENVALNQVFGKTPLFGLAAGYTLVNQLLALFVDRQAKAAEATKAAAAAQEQQTAANAAALAKARSDLSAGATELQKTIAESQAAATRNIADIEANEARQIAALDRGVDAQAKTAAATIAIQTKAAADRLLVIRKSEGEITAALEISIAAQKLSAEAAAKARIDALAPVLKEYLDHYNKLVAVAQGYAQKVDSIEQERIAFNRGVAQTLLDITNQQSSSALSVLDLYSQKVRKIDELIAAARQAGIDQNVAKAKEFTDQAIALSGTLREVVNKDGIKIVSALEAQTTATNKIKAAADTLNTAFDGASESAKDGFAEAKKGIEEVIPKIEDLQTKYDTLKATIDKGLDIRIDLDVQSVTNAEAKIAELTKARVVSVTVDTQGATIPTGGGLSRGGLVIDAAQRFARGGPVFQRPAWTKVPGTGTGDTVPAALPAGSFVLQNAARRYYGDTLLSRVARGFAGGGFVGPVGPVVDFGGLIPSLAPTSYQQFFADNNKTNNFIGDVKSGTTESVRDVGQIGPPKLPSDPRELIRKVLEYANAVVVAANPERYIFDRAITELNAELRQFDRTQDPDMLMQALQTARAIGLNLGISTGRLFGFDVDGRRWHREEVFGTFGALGFSPGAASYHFFAKGGPVDTVPAWLEPGEYVVNQPRTTMLGTAFLDAVNSKRVSREDLSAMLSPSPPRPPARFATGGLVSTIGSPRAPQQFSVAGAGLTVNIYAQTVDERTVRRDVIPIIRKAMIKSG